MGFEPKYPSGYQVSNHAYLKYYPYGTGLESVQVDGQTFPFEVLIKTDEQRSIRALTEVNADAWWGVKGLIPLLKHKNIIVFPRIKIKN